MKGKNVFFALGLSLAMGLGAVAALGANREVKKVKADADRTVYCAIDTTTLGTYTLKLNVKVANDDWRQSTMVDLEDTTTYSGKQVFKATFTEIWGGVDVMQFQLYDGSTWKDQKEPFSTWTTSDVFDGMLFKYDEETWHSDYTEPTPVVHTYQYSLNGGAYQDLIQNPGNAAEYCLGSPIALGADNTLAFKKDGILQDVAASDDGEYDHNNAYVDAGVLKVKKAVASGNFYWNASTNNVWVIGGDSAEDGAVYLKGGFNSWTGFATKATTSDDITYTFANLTLSANEELKAFVYDKDAGTHEDWIVPTDVECDHSDEYPVEAVDDGFGGYNAKVSTAGNYSLSINKNTGVYSFVAKDYVAPVYTVKIGTDTPVAVTLNEGTEYQTGEMDFVAGKAVAVYKNGVADDSFHLKVVGNNNVTTDGKVLINAHGRVYIDISAKTIFVGGLAFGGYHLVVNGTFVKMTKNNEPLDPTFREYYSELIEFKQNDIVRFVDTTGDNPDADYANVFDISKINPDSVEGFTVVGDSLKASKDLTCSVYLKLKTDNDEVYFGTYKEEVALAKNFAKSFTDAFDAICKESGQDDAYVTALAAEWQSQKSAFNGLVEKVQDVLKEATKSHSVEEIADFISAYEYIAKKYNTRLGEGYNFLSKDLGLSSNAITRTMNIRNSTTLIVVLASTVTAITAVGLFLLIKRRKEVK